MPTNPSTHRPHYFTGHGKFIIAEDEMPEDCVRPCQFWPDMPHWCPEQRLHAAIMWDAIETWRKCVGRSSAAAQLACTEIQAWLGGAPAIVPFDAVCAVLGYEPDAARALVTRNACRTRGRGGDVGRPLGPTVNRPSRSARTAHNNTAF